MVPAHEPWLVALSLLVAFQGSYVGLDLARRIRAADGVRQRLLITGAALSLGLGIWTMHFVGMLAARLPVAVDFLVLPTLLSFLVCVLVVGIAVYTVGTGAAEPRRTLFAALLMGGGIVVMHYLGMTALDASVHMTHAPGWVAASVVIGVAASGIALWFGFGSAAKRPVWLSAALMALAISAMHYTAMGGLALHAHDGASPSAVDMPALSPGLLAIVVSVVAFIVSGLFLLALVPDSAIRVAPIDTPRPDAPPRPDATPLAASLSAPAAQPSPEPARALPVEKDGRRLALDASRIVAVQAQAHYTNLFDGEAIWFCPMAISEVEAALDPAVFARVHRSHIVNLDRVAAVRRAADQGLATMASRTPYQAPVSRSRRDWLRQRLEERAGAAERREGA